MEISIYGTPTCARCNDVKNFLHEKNINYDYKIIGKDVAVDHVNELFGRPIRSVPVIMVDGSELTFDTLKEKIGSADILNELEL